MYQVALAIWNKYSVLKSRLIIFLIEFTVSELALVKGGSLFVMNSNRPIGYEWLVDKFTATTKDKIKEK